MANKTTNASELTRLINQLRQERQQHEAAIAEIDATFKAFGIVASGGRGGAKKGKKRAATEAPAATKGKGKGKRRGRKPAGSKRGSAKKAPWSRKFEVTGDELILNFVREKGGATTEEIRKHWDAAGRRGKAENNLTLLVKNGKLKRSKLENTKGRGSLYSIA
jgi:hypothetical protein